MKFKIEVILLVASALSSFTEAQFSNNSILSAIATSPSLFNGPRFVSSAPMPTAPKSKRPTLEQIFYYVHYMVVNCDQYVLDFDCTDCKAIKNDIYSYKNIDSIFGQRVLVTLSHKREEIVVSFRGTTTPMDAILDLTFINATPDPKSKIKVHAGFFIAAMSVYSQVVEAIQCQLGQNSTYKIVLTGHSLGAAMARVTHFFFQYNKQFDGIPIEIYTYGEPRSGNKYYADFLNSLPVTTARVVNKADLVPHLPPTSLLGTTFLFDNYVHVQYEFWIRSTNNVTICAATTYEDAECSNKLDPAYNVDDHLQYPGATSAQCDADDMNLLSPLNLISVLKGLPALPKYLQISPKVECGFVTDLTLFDL